MFLNKKSDVRNWQCCRYCKPWEVPTLNMLTSLGLPWWLAHDRMRLAKNAIWQRKLLAVGKLSCHPLFSYDHQILPFHLNWAGDDLRSKSCLLWLSEGPKGRRWNVLECIYHRLFVPMASSLWHFCERLNLTLSLLQTLGIIDNVWKTDMFIKNIGLCISRSASLVFQVYKEICVHWIFRCFCVRSIRAGTTMYWTDTTR